MKICTNIIQQLTIESEMIFPCCKFLYREFSAIPCSTITRENDIEKYINKLQKCIDTYHNFCIGCPSKETYETSGTTIRDMINISMVMINHHRNLCNCKCAYCKLWETPARPFSIQPLLDELLASGIVSKDARFSWGGGESTLLPEFEDTAMMLLKKQFHQQVLTNALLHSPATENMLREEMGSVMVSLDCGTAKTFRAIKGIDGFKSVTKTIKKYAAAARNIQDVTLKYIVQNHNNSRNEIDRFFDFCSTLGKITVSTAFDQYEIENLSVSNASKDALLYFRQKAGENGNPYYDWMNMMYLGVTNALLTSGSSVYYWGCGDDYQRHKHAFSHCKPKYILLEENPDGLTEKDGIPVRHPSEILPHGEKLPIVIFAANPASIVRTIAAKYPWAYFAPRICLPTSVYYWGCGDYYQRHKHEFSHCAPKYILLDHNPDNLAEMDGIPIRHPSEVLPHGERLPIFIFAWDPNSIMRTIAANYPWYMSLDPHVCLPIADRTFF